jgi:biopolymer transport protein ExbB
LSPFASLPTLLAQTAEHGWLNDKLLGVTLSSADWVLWLLAVLSILSIAIILERLVFFATHRLSNAEVVLRFLARGELEAAEKAVGRQRGLEAEVVRQGVAAARLGPMVADEVMASALARERARYERFLSVLGTLGSTAPFIGLFGTVLGIIKAFKDLGKIAVKGAAIQQTVMTGISEALVATAAGLAVAIPAVVAYNAFTRQLKNMTSSANALSHTLVAHLHTPGDHSAKVPDAPPVRAAAVVREA